ncbi:hypothetical protein TBR22_A14220 [Luteitalea sp. TBR-22]|uniref:hypothetical protein n=1 Tax=Luteitalea sp. TBR-22 TaxID=2802971 RepID=UPI001AF3D76C|nr:hypothetical protein [Luteitalea sp. TBR-22]BCS32212.1 hypothetical protein TBR22_A14220 [Luteitalea sp. TBR-22]
MTDTTSPSTPAPTTSKKRKDKVRSAWISFAGRVTAQIVGAAATVFLGLAVVSSHAGRNAAPAAPAVAQATALTPVAYVKARRAPGPVLVVLPFADYSPAAASAPIADGLTDAVTTALARSGRVHVTSRTSAMQYKQAARPVPVIAAELGVDLVLEGSIVRQGDRVRVTAQLIDAASDAHLWAQTYERGARDVLALDAELAATIERDLAGVLPRRLQAPAAASASVDASTLHTTRTTF